jgi:hypothetical protein
MVAIWRDIRRLVLLRSGLDALFEGAVHLLEATPRVGLKATGEQRDEQTLERLSLDETNTALFQRLMSIIAVSPPPC